jgi:hypothetical protein
VLHRGNMVRLAQRRENRINFSRRRVPPGAGSGTPA